MQRPTSATHRRLRTVAALAVGAVLVAPVTALAAEGESASGTVKIEEVEFNDPDNPNEVKAGCDFRIDFFGFDEQTAPITFTLEPPAGDDSEVGEVVAQREADLTSATGSESSGSLDVDLTDDLSSYQPAQAEDFDYKLRTDVVVKENGNSEVTKTANLFLDCPDAAAAATTADTDGTAQSDGDEQAAAGEEAAVPEGGVETGGRPAGTSRGAAPLLVLAAVLMGLGAWVGRRALLPQQ